MDKIFALVDCNSFYASCEKVFNPKLESKPVVVLSNNDGCIIARSQEAKDIGINMGEPAFKIKELIEKNKVNVFSANFSLYGDMSQRVMNALCKFSSDIEIYSIDEAFLDLTFLKGKDLNDYGHKIRNTVMQWTGIPVSVGIANTKTLAKIANNLAKKSEKSNGVLDLTPPQYLEKALAATPVGDVWGIGRQYEKFLRGNGIMTALDLIKSRDSWIKKHLKIPGLRTVEELRGKSCISLDLTIADKQTICTSRSFGIPVSDYKDLEEAVSTFTSRCAEKLRKQKSCACIITVFVMTNRFSKDAKYVNGKTLQLPVATDITSELTQYALTALKMIFRKGYKYKKAGVIISEITTASNIQQSLWDNMNRAKHKELSEMLDKINSTMGHDVVKYAIQGTKKRWKLRQEKLSPCYTSRWNDILTVNIDDMKTAENS